MEDGFKDVGGLFLCLVCGKESFLRTHFGLSLLQAVEIIPGRYAVCFLRQPDAQKYSAIASSGISYCIDDELVSCSELHLLQLVPALPLSASGSSCLTQVPACFAAV